MNTYYHRQREGQDFCAIFTSKSLLGSDGKNVNFATVSPAPNSSLPPALQGHSGVSADDGLVYATNTQTPSKPTYLTLVSNEVERIAAEQKRNPPRGRRAKNSVKAKSAAHRKTKAWTRLSSEDRERRVLDYALRSESMAFSLNLTVTKQTQLRKSDRPAKALADAIVRRCRTLLGRAVPISLALEVTSTGRLHAHGIATLERGEARGFHEALRSAGGNMERGGLARQTDIRKLWSATGWTAYIAKDFERTVVALGTDKIIYQCHATRAGARDEYDASLARQKASRRSKRASKSRFTDRKYLKIINFLSSTSLTPSPRQAMILSSQTDAHRGPTNRMPQYILDSETYSRLMEALLDASANAVVSKDADPFKVALGEIAGIWPDTVLASADVNLRTESARRRISNTCLDLDEALPISAAEASITEIALEGTASERADLRDLVYDLSGMRAAVRAVDRRVA